MISKGHPLPLCGQRDWPHFLSPLQLAALIIALLVLTPLISLGWLALDTSVSHWQHLFRYVLPVALYNTILLLTGVGILVVLIGAGCAWLVTAYQFPGRTILSMALFLPLAMPTYIVAFAWLDLLHPIGPLQSLIRYLLGYDNPRQFRLPELRSPGGAILLLGLVLYPYVYLTARAMFISQPANLLEAARTLGHNACGAFFRVALPMARPALAIGLSLALLEALNDIGASEFLGVHTLTVTVYTTWITRSDLAGAAQIAGLMLIFIFSLLSMEFYARRRQGFSDRSLRPISRVTVTGWRGLLLSLLVSLPVILGFLAPFCFLLWESGKRLMQDYSLSPGVVAALRNTLALALAVTLLVLVSGLLVAWAARPAAVDYPAGRRSLMRHAIMRLASLGYAVPGTILAIGFLAPALTLDKWLANLLNLHSLPLLASGTLLIICCVIRFQTIAIGAIHAGLQRIPPSLEQATRLLGETASGTFIRVHLPLLRPALISSALLVFADTMKELPTTLLLRPVGVETLATLLYGEAARGTYEEGAVAALLIVLAGVLPVMLLIRQQTSIAQ